MNKILLTLAKFVITVLCISNYSHAAPTHFAVEKQGKGPAIIFIPGLNTPGSVWNDTVEQYKTQYETHTITIKGFSASLNALSGEQAPTLAMLRDDIIRYIESENLNKPILVGHSLGGFLSMWIAAEKPELIRSQVLIDSVPYFAAITNPMATPESMKPMAEQMRAQISATTDVAMRSQFAKQMATGMTKNKAFHEQVAQWSVDANPAMTAQAMYDMQLTDLRKDINNIKAPTLILGAWIDYQKFGATKASIQMNFETQYQNLDNKTITLSDDAKHFIMLDAPNWMWTQMDSFLKQS